MYIKNWGPESYWCLIAMLEITEILENCYCLPVHFQSNCQSSLSLKSQSVVMAKKCCFPLFFLGKKLHCFLSLSLLATEGICMGAKERRSDRSNSDRNSRNMMEGRTRPNPWMKQQRLGWSRRFLRNPDGLSIGGGVGRTEGREGWKQGTSSSI